MGKALYREYRPKTLDGVIGQEHITETLKSALKKGAISHAYLFTGQKGTGKTSIARILAHEINGLKYDESETHLDIIEIDAASNRRIDEIRDLRDKVHIAPTSSKYKVYIIDEVHMLTREAFNALLKTLEEPPEHAIFILATTEAHKVPDTIISRTQRFTFKPIDQDKVISHLGTIAKSEGLKIDDEALKLLAEHGKGSFRDSISMLDQIAGFGHDHITADSISGLLGIPSSDVIASLLESVSTNDSEQLFECTGRLREQGAHAATTAQTLISILRKQLMENTHPYPSEAVKLMKDLLVLTGVQSSFESIEIALLDALHQSDAEASTKPSIEKTKPKESENRKSTEKETVVELSVAPVPTVTEKTNSSKLATKQTDTKQSAKQPSSSWSSVLEALKENYSTLYGVLRMAEIKTSGDTITLLFQFEFHRKQLNQPKNMDILKQLVAEKLGKKHTLVLEVSKSNSKPKNPSKPKPDADLKSVSNIFGGAELLE